MKMLREPAVLKRLGIGKTKFKTIYVDTGRVRWIYNGRTKRIPEHEIDALIAEDIAARDAEPPTPPKPALSHDACVKGSRNSRRL